jgi:hypothetical protein
VPAAAVIPALIAYTKVVAVKKLVVGFRNGMEPGGRKVCSGPFVLHYGIPTDALNWVSATSVRRGACITACVGFPFVHRE